MKRRQPHGIPRAGQLMAGLAAVAVAGGILLSYQLVALRKALEADVRVHASVMAENIAAPLMFKDAEAAREILRSLHPAPFLVDAVVHDGEGREFAAFHRAGTQQPALAPASGWLGRVSIKLPVRHNGQDLGQVTLRADTRAVERGLGNYIVLLGLASLGALLTSAVLTRRGRVRVARAEQELAWLAYTDPVTGLPNRRACQERLAEALDEAGQDGGQVGLLLIDLDNFKVVNDTAGHAVGDELLRQAGERLHGLLGETGLVGRFGGDEFLVIAPMLDSPARLRRIAESVLEELRRPMQLSGMEAIITASVGSAIAPLDAVDAEELISFADSALYHAKGQGRDRIGEFRLQMMQTAQRRARLERELRRAIEGEGLDLFYQPQFDCASGEMVGAEALLRWQHPVDGFIAPDEFIPIAEDCGLIVRLGAWVLERACADAVALSAATGKALSMAVNVSARQFREKDFAAIVEAALAKSGLPAGRLELELTESMLMADVDSAVQFMHGLRRLGVRLSIDDFGTGYSSLAYLQRFPINQLKIDRSFVRPLPAAGQVLASAVITLAHQFGLDVVAEGVEDEAQLAWLRDAGCNLVQGYLLGRPMSLFKLLQLQQQPQADLQH